MIDEFKVYHAHDVIDKFGKMNPALDSLRKSVSGVILQRGANVNIFQKRGGKIRVWSSFLSPMETNHYGYHFWKPLRNKNFNPAPD